MITPKKTSTRKKTSSPKKTSPPDELKKGFYICKLCGRHSTIKEIEKCDFCEIVSTIEETNNLSSEDIAHFAALQYIKDLRESVNLRAGAGKFKKFV
jgi:CRISPR/Cas system-associated protein Cas10 (large subunit of type III CRISPR-Cas system)